MKNYIRLLRPKHYVKNAFIFAPLFFSFSFDETKALLTLISFILFSMTASSIYIFNDLLDVNEDQKHPEKRYRPIASGEISSNNASFLMISLSSTSLITSYLLNIKIFTILLIYTLLNLAYTMKLKHISIVDIFIIASGFVLRLLVGSTATEVLLSPWIIVMTFLLALFLAIAKRRDDVILSLSGRETRKNIHGYNLDFVNSIMTFMAGVIVVAYLSYALSNDVISRLGSNLYLTTVFVVFGIFRYLQLTIVEKKSGNPVNLLYRDLFFQISIGAWLITFSLIVFISG